MSPAQAKQLKEDGKKTMQTEQTEQQEKHSLAEWMGWPESFEMTVAEWLKAISLVAILVGGPLFSEWLATAL